MLQICISIFFFLGRKRQWKRASASPPVNPMRKNLKCDPMACLKVLLQLALQVQPAMGLLQMLQGLAQSHQTLALLAVRSARKMGHCLHVVNVKTASTETATCLPLK